jgi:transposase InsO family protein
VSVERLCGKVGMSRQNYYKQRRQRQRRQIDEELVVSLVKRERRQQPRIGGRKLGVRLRGELAEAGIEMGRDRWFNILRDNELLVEPLPRSVRTTDSRHSLPVYRNLVRDLEATRPNQIWVSDLTYVRTEAGFVYLALIMDRYSRKIVGFHCAENLEAIGCVRALEGALVGLPADRYPIHHSDRGCQYCCHEYVYHLERRGLSISMTEEDHCYENAHAERVVGILKQEYGLGGTFRSKAHVSRATDQAVWLYNHQRPHTSLDYEIPAQVHERAA